MYSRATTETPDDDVSLDRLSRVLARRAVTKSVAGTLTTPALGELAALQTRRLEHAASAESARALTFDVAWLLLEAGQDGARAQTLLESLLGDEPGHVAALRTLERALAKTNDWAGLARVFSREGDSLRDVRARLGALWSLASIEEWKLPTGEAARAHARVLELDATDPGALEAAVRDALPLARKGDPRARKTAVAALRSLFSLAGDDGTRLAMQLRLAMLLEHGESQEDASGRAALKEALERYRAALHVDPLSVTAATGVARLAIRLRDPEGAFAAASSLAELASLPTVRARYLIDASELLLDENNDVLGPRHERRSRACILLEKALHADPDSIPAASRLSSALSDDGYGERLVTIFRATVAKASAADAIVMLGSEIARVARDDLKDLPTAIEAMRRVRAAAPTHVPSLLTLSELCIAQRTWPEAVDALEAVVKTGREAGPRLTALFALASIYERVLNKRDLAEKALRAALDIEPHNARALRALLAHIARDKPLESREEQADLIDRLAAVQKDGVQKSELLVELATLRTKMGDLVAAAWCSRSSRTASARRKVATTCRMRARSTSSSRGASRSVARTPAGSRRLGRSSARCSIACVMASCTCSGLSRSIRSCSRRASSSQSPTRRRARTKRRAARSTAWSRRTHAHCWASEIPLARSASWSARLPRSAVVRKHSP